MKAIFLDIDGTLVSFKTHEIPASTIEALEMAKARGNKIFIATGRPTVFITNLGELQSRNLIDGYVTMNGSYCYIGDKVIYHNPIAKEDVAVISEFCERNHRSCVYVGDKGVGVRNPNDALRQIFYELLNVNVIPEKPLSEILDQEIYQLSPFYTAEEEAEIIDKLDNCEIGRWAPEFADIGAKGNTKALGIDKIIEHLSIDLADTVAIGDGGNDVEMLEHAALGIAMGNATDRVKSFANYVTTSVDDDGIYNALKHFSII